MGIVFVQVIMEGDRYQPFSNFHAFNVSQPIEPREDVPLSLNFPNISLLQTSNTKYLMKPVRVKDLIHQFSSFP